MLPKASAARIATTRIVQNRTAGPRRGPSAHRIQRLSGITITVEMLDDSTGSFTSLAPTTVSITSDVIHSTATVCFPGRAGTISFEPTRCTGIGCLSTFNEEISASAIEFDDKVAGKAALQIELELAGTTTTADCRFVVHILNGHRVAADGDRSAERQGHLFFGPGMPNRNQIFFVRFKDRTQSRKFDVPNRRCDQMPTFDPTIGLYRTPGEPRAPTGSSLSHENCFCVDPSRTRDRPVGNFTAAGQHAFARPAEGLAGRPPFRATTAG